MLKLGWLSLFTLLLLASLCTASPVNNCRCFPGDKCWPDARTWADLNSTVKGRLVKTVPIGTPCHDPTYNATQCEALRLAWELPITHYETPSSVMSPFIANRSCDPFTSEPRPCLLGNYVNYAIDVNETSDIVAGIKFAQAHNIRLVVRNTGHDYLGKSTGAGSLAIWTHHHKDLQFLNYSSAHYSGPAVKMGAGIQGFEAADAADDHGFIVVVGSCDTVGVAGGFTQGGGHSPTSSKFGLGADQALEWEVIDGTGRFLTANRIENPDLFWALSGGGGSSYGVVWSLTAKVHADMPTTGAYVNFTIAGISQDTFWEAVEAYHAKLPSIVDAGIMTFYFATDATFSMAISAPGVPISVVQTLLEHFTGTMARLNIKYFSVFDEFPGYHSMFKTIWEPRQVPAETTQEGSRLILRSTIEQNTSEFITVLRGLATDGLLIGGSSVNVSKAVTGDVDNAVLPAWRDTLIHSILVSEWNDIAPLADMIANQQKMTNVWVPQLKKIEPNSGTYLNEADWQEPDWKNSFYGSNYDRLLAIKAKYDPKNTFYATKAVGSDDWIAIPGERLCKA